MFTGCGLACTRALSSRWGELASGFGTQDARSCVHWPPFRKISNHTSNEVMRHVIGMLADVCMWHACLREGCEHMRTHITRRQDRIGYRLTDSRRREA